MLDLERSLFSAEVAELTALEAAFTSLVRRLEAPGGSRQTPPPAPE